MSYYEAPTPWSPDSDKSDFLPREPLIPEGWTPESDDEASQPPVFEDLTEDEMDIYFESELEVDPAEASAGSVEEDRPDPDLIDDMDEWMDEQEFLDLWDDLKE